MRPQKKLSIPQQNKYKESQSIWECSREKWIYFEDGTTLKAFINVHKDYGNWNVSKLIEMTQPLKWSFLDHCCKIFIGITWTIIIICNYLLCNLLLLFWPLNDSVFTFFTQFPYWREGQLAGRLFLEQSLGTPTK